MRYLLILVLTGLMNLSVAVASFVGFAVTATSVEAGTSQDCKTSQSGCVTYVCPNGIRITGNATITAATRAATCNRKLGGQGAGQVADGCVKIAVGKVPLGTRRIIVAIHNPATFRNACGIEFCQDCAPQHRDRGYPDLAASLKIDGQGFVKIPTSWLQGRSNKTWFCIPGTHLTVGLETADRRYLVRHRSTPVGDPLQWGKSPWRAP